MCKSNLFPTPFTVFESIYNSTAEMADTLSWDEVREFLEDCTNVLLQSKKDARLFNGVNYKGGLRRQENATESGMMVLDIDSDLSIDEAIEIIKDQDIESILYTSASHSPNGTHKFRIVLPLLEMIPASLCPRVWDSLDELFRSTCDRSKRGEHSIFYLPADYQGVENEFHHFKGTIRSAEDWMDACPTTDPLAPAKAKQLTKLEKYRQHVEIQKMRLNNSLDSDDINWNSVTENPFVTENAVDSYLNNTANQWYHPRFAFMMSVAAVANLKGYSISAYEIVEVFNCLDMLDGSHYADQKSQRALLKDAENAIVKAGCGMGVAS